VFRAERAVAARRRQWRRGRLVHTRVDGAATGRALTGGDGLLTATVDDFRARRREVFRSADL